MVRNEMKFNNMEWNDAKKMQWYGIEWDKT